MFIQKLSKRLFRDLINSKKQPTSKTFTFGPSDELYYFLVLITAYLNAKFVYLLVTWKREGSIDITSSLCIKSIKQYLI